MVGRTVVSSYLWQQQLHPLQKWMERKGVALIVSLKGATPNKKCLKLVSM